MKKMVFEGIGRNTCDYEDNSISYIKVKFNDEEEKNGWLGIENMINKTLGESLDENDKYKFKITVEVEQI